MFSAFTFILVCNLHDISWGTKGDNSGNDLGSVTAVKGKDGQQTVEIPFPSDRAEIDRNYEHHLQALRTQRTKEKKTRDAKTKQEDYFKNFRTKTVLFWAFSNALLVTLLTNDVITEALYSSIGFEPQGDFNPYLKFLFYSVAGLSLVRFFGSMAYLAGKLWCA